MHTDIFVPYNKNNENARICLEDQQTFLPVSY